MSSTSTIPYITRETLSTLLLSQLSSSSQNPSSSTTTSLPPTTTLPSPSRSDPTPPPKKLAIIDVRDADHIGGHIVSSRHQPSSRLAIYLPTLVRTLQHDGVDVVVFHCALSQVRGPSAARAYMRERERLLGEREGRGQEVFVLKGGFVGWQEL